ncbi:MAG: hypothetical protein LC664_05395, partial [Flavobacteriales bacterium]|nr:hypothetical protein [Flavobacteriales bacterium]
KGAQLLLRPLKIDKDRLVLSSFNPIVLGICEMMHWKERNSLLWVSAHPGNAYCENCKEELWKYTKWFALAEEFLFRCSERIVNLNIQSLTNGKHWYKIAIEGSLVFEISSKRHALKASNLSSIILQDSDRL